MIEKTKTKTILISFILLSLFTYICVIFWSTSSPIHLHNNVQRTENNFIKPKSSTVTAMTTKTDYLNDGGFAYGVDVVGGYAYVADGIDGLEIISISNPYDINEVDGYNDDYDGSLEAMNVLIWKGIAYVVTKFFGMWIVESVEFINLTSVERIGQLQDEYTLPILGTTRGTKNVAMQTVLMPIPMPPYFWPLDYLYVADGWYGVEAWINPYSETPTESYIYHHNNNNSYDVVPIGNYIYVADGSDGLEIYDRTSTNLLGSYKDDDGGIAYDLYVQDDYAYIGEGSNGFEIIDISDPYNPIEIGDYYDGGTVEDIIISGNYAYIADGADGLEIVDISDPYLPKKVGNYSDGGYAKGLDLDGSYVYLADGSDGLEVIHIDFVVNFISVISPISSSKCQTGDNHLITWDWDGDITDVKITLHKNGVYFQTITASTSNDGSHIWPVSTGLAHSTQYRIKIEDATDPSVFDLSNNFEIYTNTITMSSPDSTSSWATGTSHQIYWDSTGYISSVDIILYEDGDYLDTIRTDVSNEGSFYWTISSDLQTSSKYQIKIQESGDPNVYILSEYFTIKFIPQETPIWEEIWFWGLLLVIALVTVIPTSIALHKRKTFVIKPPKKIKPFKIETDGKIFDLQIRRDPKPEGFFTFILNESEITKENKKLELKKLKTIIESPCEVKTNIFKDISSKMEILIQILKQNKNSKGLLEKLQNIGKLIRVIFPADILKELNKLNRNSPLILRLETDLLNIPWEILPIKELTIKEDTTRKSKKRDRSKNIKEIEKNLALKFSISRKIPNEEFQFISKEKKSVKILIIGDPARKLYLEEVENNIPVFREKIHDLPEARDEAKELDKILSAINGVNTKWLSGSSATREAVITELGEGYDIIHYCGHAFFDEENPGHSYLELHDKNLHAIELKNLLGENPPILAFINACLSSKEEIWREPTYENQVFGLASSFLSNGINYIGSLLPIYDKEARKTAEKFYFELLKEKPIGEALHNAKQEVFDSIKDQSLGWGSYTLYGNPLLRISYKKKKKNDTQRRKK